MFGARPYAECLIARLNGEPAGFALFFHNFSTFLAKPGIYLEDLFVYPALRGNGIGKLSFGGYARRARISWSQSSERIVKSLPVGNNLKIRLACLVSVLCKIACMYSHIIGAKMNTLTSVDLELGCHEALQLYRVGICSSELAYRIVE